MVIQTEAKTGLQGMKWSVNVPIRNPASA
jgi:hypothetical protein